MKLTKKRGFSLVELMVVVAIMGTLAAIAIPAYNEYRKSAKKTAYRTDLLSLHKGWLAFGVELDSFCERETTPDTASIGNVGMSSLTNSKLYGIDRPTAACDCACSGPPACTGGTWATASCTTSGATACNGTAHLPVKQGPGKRNMIGFTDATCTGLTPVIAAALVHQTDNATGLDAACDLDITQYKMGVFGHISGTQFIGINIDDKGVIAEKAAGLVATVNSNCS